jgi:hypothetical protein
MTNLDVNKAAAAQGLCTTMRSPRPSSLPGPFFLPQSSLEHCYRGDDWVRTRSRKVAGSLRGELSPPKLSAMIDGAALAPRGGGPWRGVSTPAAEEGVRRIQTRPAAGPNNHPTGSPPSPAYAAASAPPRQALGSPRESTTTTGSNIHGAGAAQSKARRRQDPGRHTARPVPLDVAAATKQAAEQMERALNDNGKNRYWNLFMNLAAAAVTTKHTTVCTGC